MNEATAPGIQCHISIHRVSDNPFLSPLVCQVITSWIISTNVHTFFLGLQWSFSIHTTKYSLVSVIFQIVVLSVFNAFCNYFKSFHINMVLISFSFASLSLCRRILPSSLINWMFFVSSLFSFETHPLTSFFSPGKPFFKSIPFIFEIYLLLLSPMLLFCCLTLELLLIMVLDPHSASLFSLLKVFRGCKFMIVLFGLHVSEGNSVYFCNTTELWYTDFLNQSLNWVNGWQGPRA